MVMDDLQHNCGIDDVSQCAETNDGDAWMGIFHF
jgi:hypothetical protein